MQNLLYMYNKILFILVLVCSLQISFAQKQYTFYASNSMFPLKPANTKYPNTDSRYNDNSYIVYTPRRFNKNKAWNFFFWFHGSTNNIQSTIEQFKLREQIALSQTNVILIMPEAVKNAADSYAGNWEFPNNFNLFLEELKQKLKVEKIVDEVSAKNELIIAGHSGAARVLVRLMDYSSTNIRAAFLFDAIYGNEQNIINCFKRFPNSKLINLYSQREACLRSSKKLMELLQKEKMTFVSKHDTDTKDEELRNNKILCLSSFLSHNDIPVSYNYLSRYLKAVE